MPHPVSDDKSGAQRVAVGEVLPSFSTTLSNSAVRQLVAVHRDSRVIHIFAFVEGVFALLAFLMTDFAGYIVTMLMSAVGYVGAKDFAAHAVGLYGFYCVMVMMGNMIAFTLLDANNERYQRYAFMTVVDSLLNAWIAKTSFNLNASLNSLRDRGVRVTRELVECAPRL